MNFDLELVVIESESFDFCSCSHTVMVFCSCGSHTWVFLLFVFSYWGVSPVRVLILGCFSCSFLLIVFFSVSVFHQWVVRSFGL